MSVEKAKKSSQTCPQERMETVDVVVQMKTEARTAQELGDLFQNFGKPALMAVVPNRAINQTNEQTFSIFIGLQDGNHVVYCEESSGQPQLKLVKEKIMDLYYKHQESKNYTFFAHIEKEQDTCLLESAAFLNWYISTSTEANKPIELSPKGGRRITTFYIQRVE